MPLLKNPRHETFAQLRAKGALLDDAYEDAGFVPYKGHASRLARETAVAERIAELRAEVADAAVDHGAILATLMRIAKKTEEMGTIEAARETRAVLLQATELLEDRARRRNIERLSY